MLKIDILGPVNIMASTYIVVPGSPTEKLGQVIKKYRYVHQEFMSGEATALPFISSCVHTSYGVKG